MSNKIEIYQPETEAYAHGFYDIESIDDGLYGLNSSTGYRLLCRDINPQDSSKEPMRLFLSKRGSSRLDVDLGRGQMRTIFFLDDEGRLKHINRGPSGALWITGFPDPYRCFKVRYSLSPDSPVEAYLGLVQLKRPSESVVSMLDEEWGLIPEHDGRYQEFISETGLPTTTDVFKALKRLIEGQATVDQIIHDSLSSAA